MTFLGRAIKRLLPINRYGPCVGLTLWKFGRKKIELWYAPADYETPEHTHELSDGEFWVLYGGNRWIYRVNPDGETQAYNVKFPQCLKRRLSVRAGTPHGFKKSDRCMVWVCFETWKPGAKVTSVATDFHIR